MKNGRTRVDTRTDSRVYIPSIGVFFFLQRAHDLMKEMDPVFAVYYVQ